MVEDLDRLKILATYMRSKFEHLLAEKGLDDGFDLSLYSAIHLAHSLNTMNYIFTEVTGGRTEDGAGIVDKNGNFHNHYWVEGNTANGLSFIADISADQFGYPGIVVLTREEATSRYFVGDVEKVNKAITNEIINFVVRERKTVE